MENTKFIETYAGETAHRFHWLLEDSIYGFETGREEISEFYNEFVDSKEVVTSATSARYILKSFERYLEDGEFGADQRDQVIDELIDEQKSFELDYY